MVRYAILLSLVFIAISISPASGQTPDDDLYEETAYLYDAGSTSEALAILNRLLDRRPKATLHNSHRS